MIVTVFTNDNHLWLLQGFAYLFNRFWGKTQKVRVVGFNLPKFKLPTNFEFYSLGQVNLPATEWSTGIMQYLMDIDDDLVLFMLEDYWLYQPVNTNFVRKLWDGFYYIAGTKRLLRIDLTNDRCSRKQSREYPNKFNFNLIYTPPTTPYQLSFQTGIWDRIWLLDVLQFDEDPWTSEVQGSQRLLGRDDLWVVGTISRPVIYQPVYRTHRQTLQIDRIPQPIIHELEERGCLP